MNYYSPNKFYFAKYKMLLKFGEFKVEKKEFHKSKKVIDLTLLIQTLLLFLIDFNFKNVKNVILATKIVNLLDHCVLIYLK